MTMIGAQMPAKYANDYETISDIAKYDENMKNDESNDVKKEITAY